MVVVVGATILMCYGGWSIFASFHWYRSSILVLPVRGYPSSHGGRSPSVTSMLKTTEKQIKNI